MWIRFLYCDYRKLKVVVFLCLFVFFFVQLICWCSASLVLVWWKKIKLADLDSHGNSCKPFAHSSFVELCKLTTIFCAERSLIASGKVTEWTCIKHTFLSLKGVLKTTKRGGNEASIVRADYPNAVYSLVAPLYLLLSSILAWGGTCAHVVSLPRKMPQLNYISRWVTEVTWRLDLQWIAAHQLAILSTFRMAVARGKLKKKRGNPTRTFLFNRFGTILKLCSHGVQSDWPGIIWRDLHSEFK